MLKARKCVREMAEYDALVSDAHITLRLDMNENTSGCSPRVLAKLRSLDASSLALYPCRDDGEKLVADTLGISPAQALLTNGADEAIDILCRALSRSLIAKSSLSSRLSPSMRSLRKSRIQKLCAYQPDLNLAFPRSK